MEKITEKQKCIAEQMVYGDLKAQFTPRDNLIRGKTVIGTVSVYFIDGVIMCHDTVDVMPRRYKLILRPLSDLTKEIIHKGYNDNKPFVPLVELAKIHFPSYSIFEMKVNWVNCGTYINEQPRLLHGFNVDMIDKLSQRDLLHLWHFDTRNLIKQGEAIDINTLYINPYSA